MIGRRPWASCSRAGRPWWPSTRRPTRWRRSRGRARGSSPPTSRRRKDAQLVFESAPGTTHLVTIGSSSAARPLDEVTPEFFDETLAANPKSAFFLLQALLPDPAGRRRRRQRVVGRRQDLAQPGGRGLRRLAGGRALADPRLRERLRRAPGARERDLYRVIESPDNSCTSARSRPRAGRRGREGHGGALQRVPMGRAGHAGGVRAADPHLLSDDAGFVTGQAINVTGGFHNY